MMKYLNHYSKVLTLLCPLVNNYEANCSNFPSPLIHVSTNTTTHFCYFFGNKITMKFCANDLDSPGR